MKFPFVLFSIFFAVTSFLYSARSGNGEPLVKEGILDLSGYGFTESDRIRLDGNWEFYWNRFFTSDDFSQGIPSAEREYTSIPGSWSTDTDHKAHGFGTLRLRVKGLDPGSLYSLYIPDIVSAYRLWINGREVAENGTTGVSRDAVTPQFLPRTVTFQAGEDTTELIIHVSNYHYRKSGIWRSLFIGSHDSIRSFRENRIMMEVFLSAVILAISLFHIGIYVHRRKEKTEFLFGLVCLTFVIRLVCTGEQIFTYYLPGFPWEILRRLEFIPFYASAPLLNLFLSALFPDEYSKMMNKLYIGTCSLLGFLFIVFPVRFTNHLIPAAEVLLIVGIAYALVIMLRALLHKRDGAFLIMTAYVIFSLAVINDILYANQLIPTLYIAPLGFVIFIIMQSQLLIGRFTTSFTQRELLARSRDKFKHASITDSLTGLFNVRFLHQTLEKELLNSMDTDKPLSVIMADVDNFKLYNDTWGHKQGDAVLKKMADIIRTSARDNDSPCRYGGEEFSVVFPETALKEAAEVSERIRMRFEQAEDSDKRMHGITVSIGVAQYKSGETVDSLIERADKALYEAKHNGKNRVVLSR